MNWFMLLYSTYLVLDFCSGNYTVSVIGDDLAEKKNNHSIIICLPNRDAFIEDKIREIHSFELDPPPGVTISIDFEICDSNFDINYNHINVSALLAPTYYEGFEASRIPIIFYDTAYWLPEIKDIYPYSAPLLDWKLLKTTTLKFIERMQWRRVGIVSDDSLFSGVLEKEFTSEFNKKEMEYASEQCEGRYCEFEQVFHRFRIAKARIIIVNVDDVNMEKVIQAAKKTGFIKEPVVWILRTYPSASLKVFQKAYFIYLSTDYTPSTFIKRYNNIINNIFGALSIVDKELSSMKNIKEIRGYIAKREPTEHGIAYVLSISNYQYNTPNIILTMTSSGDRISHTISNQAHHSDIPSCTIMRTGNFYKPCNDILLLYIVLVILVFLALLLIIIWSFKFLRPPYQNYIHML